MSVEYSYQASAFPNDCFNEDRLKLEVGSSPSITTTLDYVRSREDVETHVFTAYLGFASELSTEEQSALDAVVAAHSGAPIPTYIFHASSTLCEGEHEITDAEWIILGGVVTTPSFFMADLSKSLARVVGSFKTVGESVELRVCEDGVPMGTPHDLDASADVWATMQWYISGTPSEGTHEYTLEGRLVTATSAAVRFVSMSLLGVVL